MLVVPCLIIALLPLKVKFASPCIAFAPVTVQTVLSVDPDSDVPADIPVKFDPSPTNYVALNAPVAELKLSLLLLV